MEAITINFKVSFSEATELFLKNLFGSSDQKEVTDHRLASPATVATKTIEKPIETREEAKEEYKMVDVRAQMMALYNKGPKGVEISKELLHKYGAHNLTELESVNYRNIINDFKSELAKFA